MLSLKKTLIFNTGVNLLIGWRGRRGGEWIKGEKEVYFKVNYCGRLSSAVQKEHALEDKSSCYVDDAERKDAEIPPLATKTEGE